MSTNEELIANIRNRTTQVRFMNARGISGVIPESQWVDACTKLADALEQAESRLRAVEKLAKEAEDEGLEHTHLRAEFHDLDCGICWATVLRQALGQVPGGGSGE